MDKQLRERFGGIDRLYGSGALARFAANHVTVVGVGGVGSWAVEALARSGIGKLTLVDADDLCVSNTNRQLPALQGQYGRAKIEAMAERCRAINPHVELDLRPQFLTPSNLEEMLGAPGEVVLDACDSFRSKVEAIAYCRRRKQPIITVGSAGGRSDVTQIRVRDLSRTEHDAMLSLIRRKLRGEFNFPKNHDRYFGVPAIYSLENVR
ncbi:MAG: tRNA threonylcarbamoyladenosine dehydratase, partial [Lysobacteraceae bacterium]